MSASAVTTMLIGMVAIWGGMAASITLVLRRARRRPSDAP